MYLYFDRDGTLKEQINDLPLRTQSSNINSIFSYWVKGDEISADVGVATITYYKVDNDGELVVIYNEEDGIDTYGQDLTVPRNEKRDLYYFKYYTPYRFFKFIVPDEVLALNIDVVAVIKYYLDDDETIIQMGAVPFHIDGVNITVDELITVSQYNTLQKRLANRLQPSDLKTIEGQSIVGTGDIDITKQDVDLGDVVNKPMDNIPTQNSDNYVKSGGVFNRLAQKQDVLVSATNIKTINGNSLLGAGNIEIQSGGGDCVIEEIQIGGVEQPVVDKVVNLPAYPTRTTLLINNVNNTSDLDKPVSTATQEAIDEVDDKLDAEVLALNTTDTFTYSGDTVEYNFTSLNLQTGSSEEMSETIALANGTTAGMMSPADYNAIRNNTSRIEALEGQTVRLLYTAKENPTKQDIVMFVNDLGYTTDLESVAVVVAGTYHIWHFYTETGWRDDGVDTVNTFTNSQAGIIKGATTDGQIFAENDGTGSVNGWSALKTRVSNAETAIAGKQATLVSGTNIKTINGNSVLGSGNITIESGTEYSAGYGINISSAGVISADTGDLVSVGTTQNNITGDKKFKGNIEFSAGSTKPVVVDNATTLELKSGTQLKLDGGFSQIRDAANDVALSATLSNKQDKIGEIDGSDFTFDEFENVNIINRDGFGVEITSEGTIIDGVSVSEVEEAISGKLDATKQAVAGVGGLVVPTSAPTDLTLVGVETDREQAQIYLGDGLEVEGDTSPYTMSVKIYRHRIVVSNMNMPSFLVEVFTTKNNAYTKNELFVANGIILKDNTTSYDFPLCDENGNLGAAPVGRFFQIQDFDGTEYNVWLHNEDGDFNLYGIAFSGVTITDTVTAL